MGSGPLTSVLRHLHRLLGAPGAEAADDAQLLQRFARERDQHAFAALVQRHGALVWGVCRRVLGHEQDAEDAFQATFLVLARKAGTVRRREALGAWLYEVAYHVALKARAAAARRRQCEREAGTMLRPDGSDEQLRQEVRRVLDEELHRLPPRYRRLLVLCDLQGRTHQEAARELGLPPGSVSRHLGRGRELLRERLVRRGITLSAAALASCLGGEAAPRATAALAAATAEAARAFVTGGAAPARAAALAKGVLQAMFLTRLKIAMAALLLAGVAAAGAGYTARRVGGLAPPVEAPPSAGGNEALPRTDRQGDPLPGGALARLGTTRFRLGGWAQAVAFTRDGRGLLSASGGGTPRLWDVNTGRELRTFGLPAQGGPGHLALSPDGRVLASAGDGNAVYLWDAATGKQLARLAGHRQPVISLAFSPDGKLLATGSEIDWPPRGQENPIILWDVATGKEVRRLAGHKDYVLSLAFSPDGLTLASGGGRYDATLRLWDVETGAEVHRRTGHDGELWAVAFSPDGKTLASASMDKTIRLWDPATALEKGVLTGHTADVMAVAFAPDSKCVVSGSADGTLRLWDVGALKQVWQAETWGGFLAVSFAPDGKTVAAGGRDHTLRLFDAASGKEVRPVGGPVGPASAVALTPDGAGALTLHEDGVVRLWDTATGSETRSLPTRTTRPLCLALSPDGRLAATGGEDKAVRLWEIATGKERRQIVTPDTVGALAFAPDGRALATGTRWKGAEVRLWEVGTGKLLHALPMPGVQGNAVVALDFTPDGVVLVAATYDGDIFFWDPATGRPARPTLKHFEHCQGIALAPDGRTLAVGNMNGTVCLYETATCRERGRGRGFPFRFSPDGRLLASGRGDAVALWDLADGREVRRLRGHRGRVTALGFSPDGGRLVSGSEDTTALVWDMAAAPRSAGPGPALPAEKLERLWADLAGENAVAAYRAVWTLASAPGQSVPFLSRRLRLAPAPDEERLARLLAGLDSEDFGTRERAQAELRRLGPSAEGALRRARAGKLTPEARRRVEALLDRIWGYAAEELRALRALEALERTGSPEARAVVDRVAREARGTRTGRAAKEVLRRLAGARMLPPY